MSDDKNTRDTESRAESGSQNTTALATAGDNGDNSDSGGRDFGMIGPMSIESEMRSSFIDYAMSVIVSRALPDVRDGLKPVHRRILYAMHVLKNFHNQPYKKSARIVGDVIGKYHPHGDSAVYEALVRMAQTFSLRHPLADGQGNFGSIDGDPAAAMRYTEIRISKIGDQMLRDIDMDTVDWSPNYDEKELEPDVLPARVPNLLVNGTQGIAVGMATNIPPHNLGEVIDATIAMIENPEIELAELIKHVPGPDFPTAATIYGRGGIMKAYATGRGSVVIRAKTHIEELKRDKEAIIVTELPYQVNKAKLLERIAELNKTKRIDGITDLRDESDRRGIRVVIELRRDVIADVVLNQLYKMTPLQDSFGMNMVAIVDGKPRMLGLSDILKHFIEHRRDVVTRRTVFKLSEAKKRQHILEGLKIALDHLDEIIKLIRSSPTPDVAKSGLIDRFDFSGRQAQAILDMRLQRLTGLERDKIIAELKSISDLIDNLESILADQHKLLGVVADELKELRESFANPRRTEIIEDSGDIVFEDLIAKEDMIVTLTHSGYVKRAPMSEYRSQKRGGKGMSGMTTKEEDFVSELFLGNTHDTLLMFTSLGRVYQRKVYDIPQSGRTSRGKAIVNLLDLKEGERVDSLLSYKDVDDTAFIVFATRSGTVKRTALSDFKNIRQNGIKAIEIADGDELIDARLTSGETSIILSSHYGLAIQFHESELRPMGRTARGVRGIKLRDGDHVVSMALVNADTESTIVTVCEKGYGKRTDVSEFGAQARGGKGRIAIKTSERNGNVAGAKNISAEDDQLMMITNGGKVIRMSASDIPTIGRNTQGVRLIRLSDDESVVSIERLANPGDDDSSNDDRSNESELPNDTEPVKEDQANNKAVKVPNTSSKA